MRSLTLWGERQRTSTSALLLLSLLLTRGLLLRFLSCRAFRRRLRTFHRRLGCCLLAGGSFGLLRLFPGLFLSGHSRSLAPAHASRKTKRLGSSTGSIKDTLRADVLHGAILWRSFNDV